MLEPTPTPTPRRGRRRDDGLVSCEALVSGASHGTFSSAAEQHAVCDAIKRGDRDTLTSMCADVNASWARQAAKTETGCRCNGGAGSGAGSGAGVSSSAKIMSDAVDGIADADRFIRRVCAIVASAPAGEQ